MVFKPGRVHLSLQKNKNAFCPQFKVLTKNYFVIPNWLCSENGKHPNGKTKVMIFAHRDVIPHLCCAKLYILRQMTKSYSRPNSQMPLFSWKCKNIPFRPSIPLK